VLDATAKNLGRIHSADLGLRLVLAPRAGAPNGQVGFELRGPVDLRAGGLPVARLAYTQIAGARQGGATVVSTGRKAFVEVGGSAYRLPRAQADSLAASAGQVRRNVQLPLGRWVRDPKVSDGGEVGGTRTDHVSAGLDAVAALRDIFSAAASAGAQVPDLGGTRADELRKAIKQSSIDLWSGRDDHLLRRLRLRIGFEVAPPAPLRARLGSLTGGTLAFDVDLANVNRPVQVAAPANPRPASKLPRG
jgi:hypothetical protein